MNFLFFFMILLPQVVIAIPTENVNPPTCDDLLKDERTLIRLSAIFNSDREAEQRAGGRGDARSVSSYKQNVPALPGRVIPAHRLLPTGDDLKALRYDGLLGGLERPIDLRTELPRHQRTLVDSLRKGDVIEFADGERIVLGEFVDWGGTNHLFAIEGQPGQLLRVPRAARIKYTRAMYQNLGEKTRYYYEAYRDALKHNGNLPTVDYREKDGLVIVQMFAPFLSAAEFGAQFREAPAAMRSFEVFGEKRQALISFLQNLAGQPGLLDVHLDSLAWEKETKSWRIADFGERVLAPMGVDPSNSHEDVAVQPKTEPPQLVRAAYRELVDEARRAFEILPSELDLHFERELHDGFRFYRIPTVPMPLEGIVTPLVTPLTRDDKSGERTVDALSLSRLLDHVLNGGVRAVMILGTTGEGAMLSHAAKVRMIRETCRLMEHRAPVLVNVSANALDEVFRLVDVAQAHGASAVTIMPPSGYRLTESELLGFVRRVAEYSRLPVFLYNFPAQVHQSFSPDLVAAAAQIPGVIGIKDSSGDLNYLKELKKRLEPYNKFTVLVGSESKLRESLELGAHGGVSGSSNLVPELFTNLYREFREGDSDRLDKAAADLVNWKRQIRDTSGDPNAQVKFIKAMLVGDGIIGHSTAAESISEKGQ